MMRGRSLAASGRFLGLSEKPRRNSKMKVDRSGQKINKVTGIVLKDAGTYIDPQTGTTMAKISIEWAENATSENVVDYEIVIQEKQTKVRKLKNV
jgi:hypothetical protein